jgi:hypothetical protein
VLPLGSGSKLGLACGTPRVPTSCSRARASRASSAYEPADGTLTARRRLSHGAPRRTLPFEGHHLTPDVLAPEDAARFGGVVAAGVSGLDRLRHGPVRHHAPRH